MLSVDIRYFMCDLICDVINYCDSSLLKISVQGAAKKKSPWFFCNFLIIIIIIIRIYYGAAQPVLNSALQYNNVIADSGN